VLVSANDFLDGVAICSASTTSSERGCSAIAQPTTRRLKQSKTTAGRTTLACAVLVMSAM
jgi:hypothetical protein